MAAEAWQLDIQTDPALTDHPSLGVCLTVLIGVSVFFIVWGAFRCSRTEFHVKTPEGELDRLARQRPQPARQWS